MKRNLIHNENCLTTMEKMPTGFLDLVVTSPPYDDLREYNGYTFPFEEIIAELSRVVKEGGVVVWVVGDATIKGSETLTSFKQALFFKEMGFNVHDTMIYEKLGGSPPSGTRYIQSFEFMFVFSKGKPKTINLLRDKPNKWAGQKAWGDSKVRAKDGSLKSKKDMTYNDFGIRTNIWSYARGYGHSTQDKESFGHPAIFPEALAQDHILSWSNEGDLVYDPFMGSGTTAKMCLLNGRDFIGSEISEEYCLIIEERLSKIPNWNRQEILPIKENSKSVSLSDFIGDK